MNIRKDPLEYVTDFEELIANYFGAPYAVAVDCCTHALELCFRLTKPTKALVPGHTYLSVPFMLDKIKFQTLRKIIINYLFFKSN